VVKASITLPVAPSDPRFSVREIPFSHCGSWFCFSPVIAENVFADDVHLVSHQAGMHPVLRLVPWAGGARAQTTVTATPSRLTWTRDGGRIELSYETADTVRVRGTGLGLRVIAAAPTLTPFSGPYFLRDPADDSYLFTLYETGRRYRLTPLSGPPQAVIGEQRLGTSERGITLGEDHAWELAIV
jgi:hypothetical protein